MYNRHQELTSPEQTVSGKDLSNPLIADSLLKNYMVINSPCCYNEALTISKQMALGKEFSNLFLAGSLPKTIWICIDMDPLEFLLVYLVVTSVFMLNRGMLSQVIAVKDITINNSIDSLNHLRLQTFSRETDHTLNPTSNFSLLITTRNRNGTSQVVVSEDIIRRDLHLDDADGIECLLNEEIFKDLARIGYKKPPPKLTFYKAFFSAQWKFWIHTLVQCLSAKRTAWNEFSCFMASAVICLATGRKFNFSKYIFDSMVRNVDIPSKFVMYPGFLQVVLDNQVDNMSTHNTRYTSLAFTQKVFANMRRVGKGFSGVETPLFASMLLKKRVKKLEKKKSKSSGFKRLRRVGGKIETIDVDKGIILVDVETNEEVVAMDTKSQGRINQEEVNAASKGVSAAKPTVFDNEDVTMTMAQTLIKLKAKKSKILNEQIAQKLYDEEVQKAATRDRQEKADMERVLELQRQYDDKEKNIDWNVVAEQVQEIHIDNIRKYQNLKKKLVSIAQARKNMIIYLKNMVGYKMEFFRGLTYDKLYTDCGVHHVSSTRGYDIFMLTEKDYHLLNAVMIRMLSRKLQVEEDNEMDIDLVMKIFMEANKPKSKSLDLSSK
nr:hypothetical protein [Tanacetum cinerariifolium]